MTKALDAAWDAVHVAMNAGEVTNCLSCETCPSMPCACAEDLARAALSAALPEQPTQEMLDTMAPYFYDEDWKNLGALYRAVRRAVLGGGA